MRSENPRGAGVKTPSLRQLAFHFRTTAAGESGAHKSADNGPDRLFHNSKMQSENEVFKFELNAAIDRLLKSSERMLKRRRPRLVRNHAAVRLRGFSGPSAHSNDGSFSGSTPEIGTVKIELDAEHNEDGRSVTIRSWTITNSLAKPQNRFSAESMKNRSSSLISGKRQQTPRLERGATEAVCNYPRGC